MSTIPLPKRFELRGDSYTLAYFPGDTIAIEPNFSAMKPLQAGVSEVIIHAEKKHMTWCVAEIPAKIGANVPARRFLLFYLADRPIAPDLCPMANMIVYAVHQQQQSVSMEQQFINMIIGIHEEVAPPAQDDWAKKIFVVSDDDASIPTTTTTQSSGDIEAWKKP